MLQDYEFINIFLTDSVHNQKTDKMKDVTVNICNAAEKIEDYPEVVQKLVWRALHYQCEIETRQSESMRSSKDYEKLTKYVEAFRQTQKLIIKMCRKRNLRRVIIKETYIATKMS